MQDDIEHPASTMLYTISCMHCMTASLGPGSEGLGTMWGEATARRYLREARFGAITTHRLVLDIQNIWYVVTR